MTASHRIDDPPEFDGSAFRADEPTLRVGYKAASLSVKGVSVFILLGLLLVLGTIMYHGWRTEQSIERIGQRVTTEHVASRKTLAQALCLFTMSPDRQAKLRERYYAGAFKQECPWVEE